MIIKNNILKQKNNNLQNTFKRLPYELIPFVLSMFVVVLSLDKHEVTTHISNILGEKNIILKYGVLSFISANLINNIPMSVLFSTIPNFTDSIQTSQAIYSTIIGSNLGAFLTPIGALAGIMFMDLVRKQEVKFSFGTFIKYGIIIMVPTLFIALGMLSVWFY